MSMKPGATAWPAASITRAASRQREGAAHALLLVDLRRERVARAAGAVALRAGALHDEVGHDAVEVEAVVEALLGQGDEVLDGLGRVVREELEPNLAALLER